MRLPLVLIAALALTLSAGATANAVPVVDGEFSVPNKPNRLAPGPDGNMWMTMDGANQGVAKITPDGTVTPFTSADFQSPVGIVAGPDGNMWVTQSNSVVRFAPSNPTATTLFAVDIVQPQSITVGPDGNLWTASADKVFKIPTSGVEQTFPGIVSNARGITSGGDGRLWIADFNTPGVIYSVSTAGVGTPHTLSGGTAQEVAAGPGNQIAYTNPSDFVGRLEHGGVPQPTAATGTDAFGITFGSDQAYWIALPLTNNLGRLTSDGQLTTLGGLAASSNPRYIAAGPGNTLWVALQDTNKIARVSGLEPPDTTPPVVSAFSVNPRIFRVGRSQTPAIAKRVPVGTKIHYTLSEAATVKLSFKRQLPGRRVGTRCAAPRKSLRRKKKCKRLSNAGALTRQGRVGANTVAFSGRIGRRALKPGSYEVRIAATDAAGNASVTVLAKSFKIKSRG